MDTTQYFTSRAKDYVIGRPVYATEFIEYLYEKRGFSDQSIIADIGSGTGKFARQLLEKESIVYCVEPNDDMRNAAMEELRKYKKFRGINGTAADTALPDKSEWKSSM